MNRLGSDDADTSARTDAALMVVGSAALPALDVRVRVHDAGARCDGTTVASAPLLESFPLAWSSVEREDEGAHCVRALVGVSL